MKKKSFLILVFITIVFAITTKYNTKVRSFVLDFINPIKVSYLKFQNVSSSYLNQQEEIVRLKNKNIELNRLLVEESNYIEQLSRIYKVMPSLIKKPYRSIYVVDTISYVKLNKQNEIMLTTPKNLKLESNKLYGLIQNDVVAGVAIHKDTKLYGYLLTNPKSTFSVLIGKDNINGIAQGDGLKSVIIKYIPRSSNVKVGDIVTTSGLDNLFFPNIPVGVVTSVKTLDRYKEAKIKIYVKLEKPSIFFLVLDASPYITKNYSPKTTFPNTHYPFIKVGDANAQATSEASQAKDDIVNPTVIKENDYLDILDSNPFWKQAIQIEGMKIENNRSSIR